MFKINWPWSSRTSQMDTLRQENSALRAKVEQQKKELSLLHGERVVSIGNVTALAATLLEATRLVGYLRNVLNLYNVEERWEGPLLDTLKASLNLAESICAKSTALQTHILEGFRLAGTQKQTDSSCQCKMLKGISLG